MHVCRSGTFGMEAVARQFATNEHVMVIRNGWFSFRWTEIFDMGGLNTIPRSHTVLMAQPTTTTDTNVSSSYEPYPIEDVIAKIKEEQPAVLFAPHVETSTGMLLPDDYIQKAAQAMHEIGGLFVLDCIASGTVWADMKHLGVDVVISAPQKGWTGPACAASARRTRGPSASTGGHASGSPRARTALACTQCSGPPAATRHFVCLSAVTATPRSVPTTGAWKTGGTPPAITGEVLSGSCAHFSCFSSSF